MSTPKQPTTSVDPIEWFERTGHCGRCGDPGGYCTCRGQCPCAHLHPPGSARDEDALDRFTQPVAIDDIQPDLWEAPDA
jgi:hypothetical protein